MNAYRKFQTLNIIKEKVSGFANHNIKIIINFHFSGRENKNSDKKS